MFNYNFINNPKFKLDENIIKEIFKNTEKIIFKKQKWTLNIVFLTPIEIQNLNKVYRNIDKTTDVLSFHYFDDFSNLKKEDTAWEIILSEEKINSQAVEYWLWNEKEFYKLLIHSTLHILWYDHEIDSEYKIMQDLENKIWKEVFEK